MRPTLTYLFTALLLTAALAGASEESGPVEGIDYDGPIIDMHAHAFSPDDEFWFPNLPHPPTMRGETYTGVESAEAQRDQTLERFRRHHVVKALVDGGAGWVAHAPDLVMVGQSGALGKLLSVEELRSRHADGALDAIAELAPYYAGLTAGDEEILPYFALAEELDIPLGFHIYPGGPNGGYYSIPGLQGMRITNADPKQLEAALIAHPKARVYVGHGGWPFVEDMKALMYAHPQVYVDVSVINWALPEAELHAYLKALIDAGFGKRIMFGSDQMVWPEVITLGIRAIDSAPFLTDAQKADIFYNNAARFLGLSDEEMARHHGGE